MKPSAARVLAYLRTRGADGASEAEIQSATAIRSGAQRIHELRAEGHVIERRMERSPIGAQYARWYLTEERGRFQATEGEQEGLPL